MHKTELTLTTADILAIAEQVPDKNHSREYRSRDFCSDTYEKALEYMRSGYKCEADKLSRIYQKTKGLVEFKELTYVKETNGLFFDVGEVLQGIPECWYAHGEDAPKKVLDIYVDTQYHCGITQESVMNRGAAIVAVVDKLSQDYCVNLYGVIAADSGKTWSHRVFIKIDTQPIDLDEIAFLFTCPAFVRRIYFGLAETWEKEDSLSYCGYGKPRSADGISGLYLTKIEKNDDYDTPETALETVMKMVYNQVYTKEEN